MFRDVQQLGINFGLLLYWYNDIDSPLFHNLSQALTNKPLRARSNQIIPAFVPESKYLAWSQIAICNSYSKDDYIFELETFIIFLSYHQRVFWEYRRCALTLPNAEFHFPKDSTNFQLLTPPRYNSCILKQDRTYKK